MNKLRILLVSLTSLIETLNYSLGLAYISAVLKAGEMDFGDAIICEVFLKDMGDFGVMNKVYAEIFDPYCKDTGYPARAAVAVKTIPKDCLVEIKVTAIKDE